MEVHGINSYGKDPFVSSGKVFNLKYPPKKQTQQTCPYGKKKFQIPEPIEVQ